MKNISVIIVALLFSTFLNAQVTYEWSSVINFDTIHNIGQKHVFKQFCNTDTDSIISNGTLIFSNAKIGSISKCKYSIFVSDTVIQCLIIHTFSKKSTTELNNYVGSLLLNNDSFEFNKSIISNFVIINEQMIYTITYIETKNKKKGILYINRSP